MNHDDAKKVFVILFTVSVAVFMLGAFLAFAHRS